MKPERFKRIDQLFQQALSQPPEKRGSFLEGVCAGDEDLRSEVESLIEHDKKAQSFIDSPVTGSIAADQVEESHADFVGRTLLHYRIVERVGEGGMGVVYRAEDSHLTRSVAIKLLPAGKMADPERRRRFIHEARAASALNHPNIITIYDISSADGIDFIAMEYVAGKPLAQLIGQKGLPLRETLKYAIQIADALEKAHRAGIIHRDLKPSNIMVTEDGLLKLLDFGLAKLTQPPQGDDADSTKSLTQSGAIIGTAAYMSPEQAEGKAVDARSDIFSFGAVLYEMVTGRRAFKGDSNISTLSAVLHEEPEPVSRIAAGIPQELERIISRCLKKDPGSRFEHMDDVELALEELKKGLDFISAGPVKAMGLWRIFGRPAFVIPGLIVIAVLGYLTMVGTLQNRRIRWAREVALPSAQQLIARNDWASAYAVAVEAEKYISGDPELKEVFADASVLISIETEPPGARVYLKEYAKGADNWEFAGLTPIESLRISRGFKEYKITRDGHDPVTGFTGSDQRLPPAQGVQTRLTRALGKAGTTPGGMVRIDGGKHKPTIRYFSNLPEADLEPYYVDQFEVTNKQYQEFVNVGGYRERGFWKHEFTKEGRKLSWEDAVAGFVDKTGILSPASWDLGHFPEGQDNYPVGGVSWYEAAAYAEFAGKSLPTAYHWNKAAGVFDLALVGTNNSSMVQPVVLNSNFGDAGPVAVGKYRGISPYGAFDMAGNVREWIWNGLGERRYLLGGSWGVPEYLYYERAELISAFDRSPSNGFRCVKLPSGSRPPNVTLSEIRTETRSPDMSKAKPVKDSVFKIYCGYYSYEKRALDPKTESIDDSSKHHVRQKVSFNAAYAGERVIAYLYLPRRVKAPYQTVVIFPGANAQELSSIDAYSSIDVNMFSKSGRAVVYPIYKGTFERRPVDASTATLQRDYRIMLYKDLATTLDYLETRPGDFDINKVGYFGLCWGAIMAPIMGALEKRIKVFVLEGGGLTNERLGECDPVNFAPRHTAPTLLLNGRYDMEYPVETVARPLIKLLGTPERDKRIVLFDGGHIPPLNSEVKRQLVNWLDRYLGPVKR